MSNVVFPDLKGLTWDIRKTPEFFNLVQKSTAPGYDTRVPLGTDPIYHFELSYSVLRETAFKQLRYQDPNDYNELHRLEGFFNSRQGDYDSFLLDLGALTKNTEDSAVYGQILTPDANDYAPLVVSRDTYNETIYELSGSPIIYMDDVVLTLNTDYTIQGPGFAASGVSYPGMVVVFITNPTGEIKADIGWYYRVRFEQSMQEFNEFMYLLWEAKQVKLIQTRT